MPHSSPDSFSGYSPSLVRNTEVSHGRFYRVPHGTAKRVYTAWLGYAAIIALYTLVFSFWQVEPVPNEVHILDILVAAICFLPITLWYVRGESKLPLFEIICVMYLISFGIPVYLQNNYIVGIQPRFTWENTFQALLVLLLGVSALIAGFYLKRIRGFLQYIPKLDLPLPVSGVSLFLKIFIPLGAGVRFLRVAGLLSLGAGLDAPSRIIDFLFLVAIVLLAYRVWGNEKNQSRSWALLLFATVGFSVLSGLATGMLESALIPLLLLFVVKWRIMHRLPIFWLILGVLIFTLLNTVKSAYRSQVWNDSVQYGLIDKVGVWLDLSQNFIMPSSASSLQGSDDQLRQSVRRLDHLHTLELVMVKTPESVPFYNGETYTYFLYGWIPRFIWPNKPVAQEGNTRLAVDYGLLLISQTNTTAIGISQLAESYANFGMIGVALIMALQGLFFAVLDKSLNDPRSHGGQAIYLVVMAGFINGIGGVASSIFAGIIPTVLASLIILRFFAGAWRHGSSSIPRSQVRGVASTRDAPR